MSFRWLRPASVFDHIVQHRLYDAKVQAAAKTIDFPSGAMLVKAAWREVTPEEEPSYHTVTACVCDRDANGQPINCETKRMGLVGLHVTQKTPSSPQWIWSTFEQVDNVTGPGAWAVEAYIHSKRRLITPPSKPTATSKK